MRWAWLRQYSQHRIDAAGIGICLLASLLWYVSAACPFMKQRAVTAKVRREMQTQEEKALELKQATAKVKERLAAVRQEQAGNTIQLDLATHINKRVAGLTQLLSECRLQVDDVQTGRVSSNPRYDLVPISLMGKGCYTECVRFLQGLCLECPDMSLIRIEVSGNPAQPAEPQKFRFDLFWYAAPSRPVENASGPDSSGNKAVRS